MNRGFASSGVNKFSSSLSPDRYGHFPDPLLEAGPRAGGRHLGKRRSNAGNEPPVLGGGNIHIIYIYIWYPPPPSTQVLLHHVSKPLIFTVYFD